MPFFALLLHKRNERIRWRGPRRHQHVARVAGCRQAAFAVPCDDQVHCSPA
jgi:hypothetical protein